MKLTIADRSSEHMLRRLDHLAEYDDEQLTEVEDDALREFGALTLWRDLPADQQGDRDARGVGDP